MKTEVLNAIAKLELDCSDFEHQLENEPLTTAQHTYEFESTNYLIRLGLIETVRWSSYDDNEQEDLEVLFISIRNEDSELLDHSIITDEEILNNLNY